ncbi:MAG: hypothetical protein WCC46_04505 [Terriglobales bacterium]
MFWKQPMINSGSSGRAEIRNRLCAGKRAEYLSQSAIAESVTEFRSPLNRLEERLVIGEHFNRSFPVTALHSPREWLIVPSQRKTVHCLLDSPLLVDDPRVVGEKKLKKLLTLLVALQAVNGKTFAAVVLEVGTARCDVVVSKKGYWGWSGASAHADLQAAACGALWLGALSLG